MRHNIIIATILSMLTLISCSKDKNIDTADDKELVEFTVKGNKDAEQEKQNTKTSFDNLTFSWATNDALGLFVKDDPNNQNVRFNITTTPMNEEYYTHIENFSGTFDVSGWGAAETFYAVYPNQAVSGYHDSVVEFSLPTTQVQRHDPVTGSIDKSSLGNYAYMASGEIYINNPTPESQFGLTFNHLMSFIDFRFSNANGKKIESVTMTGENPIFGTKGVIDYTTSVLNDDFISTQDKVNSVSVNIVDSPVYSTGFVARLAIFPVDFTASSENVTIYVTTVENGNRYTYTINKTLGINFKRGERNYTTLNLSGGVVQPPLANSYMVAPGNTVSIPVAQANADGTVRIYNNDAINYKFLWTDNSNGMSASGAVQSVVMQGTGSSAKLNVTAGSAEGCALIAVTDASENILWSWHIWVTNYDPVGEYDIYGGQLWGLGGENYGRRIMNRNLGALEQISNGVSAYSMGMVYQWGRKDPFPGHWNSWSTVNVDPPIYDASGQETSITVLEVTKIVNNLPNAVANPMSFYISTDTGHFNDWYTGTIIPSNQNNDLWGHDRGKTAYDPCPPGWRVPPAGTWDDFADEELHYKPGYSELDLTNYQMTYDMKGTSTYTVFYPQAGFKDGTTGTLSFATQEGRYWSKTPNGSRAFGMVFTQMHLDPNFDHDGIGERSDGYPVRCIEE